MEPARSGERGAGEAPQHLDESLQFGPGSLKRCLGQRRLPYGRRVTAVWPTGAWLTGAWLTGAWLTGGARLVHPTRPGQLLGSASGCLLGCARDCRRGRRRVLVATVEREGAEGICGERAALLVTGRLTRVAIAPLNLVRESSTAR